jgi:hypothetical protein
LRHAPEQITRYVVSVINVFVALLLFQSHGGLPSPSKRDAQRVNRRESPLSICEVIAKRTEYNGRLIAIRGEISGGGHGAWLVPSSACEYKLVTKGVEWPIAIFLDYPNNKSPHEDRHAPFRVDWRMIQKAEETVQHAGFNPNTDRVIQTYVGLFVTYPDLEARISPGVPGALRLGFGPVGLGAPAELLIKTVSDATVVRGRD